MVMDDCDEFGGGVRRHVVVACGDKPPREEPAAAPANNSNRPVIKLERNTISSNQSHHSVLSSV
jgi:hypothetical protein